jgi:hypothetical protein
MSPSADVIKLFFYHDHGLSGQFEGEDMARGLFISGHGLRTSALIKTSLLSCLRVKYGEKKFNYVNCSFDYADRKNLRQLWEEEFISYKCDNTSLVLDHQVSVCQRRKCGR